MLPVLLPSKMQEADRRTIEGGTPSSVLMERAGHAVATVAARFLQGAYGRRVLVLAGKGNNGGDGLVVARKLHRMGALVRIALAEPPKSLRGDPLEMYERLVPLALPVGTPSGEIIQKVASRSDLVVDALFGTGFRGAASGLIGDWIDAANRAGAPVIAVDIPSGLDGTDGSVRGPAISATLTVALQALKCGHLLGEGPRLCGEIEVVDIGVEVRDDDACAFVPEAPDVAEAIPRRPLDAHKWSAGSVCVVGGSAGMSGAAVMAARSALRAGAGMVALALPRSVQKMVAPSAPELVTRPLEETPDGAISEVAFEAVAQMARRYDVLAVGPGMGRDPSTGGLVKRILAETDCPVVLDADGLNLLGRDAYREIGEREAPTVLTPHPAEMARLLGTDAATVDRERLAVASEVAAKWECVVLLKGPRTIVAGPEGTPIVNVTGTPALATAGTGDVLTGIVAALIAAGAKPTGAAMAAAYVHGVAGRIAGRGTSGVGVTAVSVLEAIPTALAEVVSARRTDRSAASATGTTRAPGPLRQQE